MTSQLLLGAFFAFVVAAGSYALRFLTLSGAIATLLLGVVVFGAGGWQWAVPMVTFFLLSSLLSKYGRTPKKPYDEIFGKSLTRDWGQVAANGGIAGALVLLSTLYPIYDFYPIYLGALAAVTADTWGTEIGILTKGRTISVLSMQPVAPGTSGGISEHGTIAGATGALVIALSGYLWFSDLKTAIIVVLAGIAGSLGDSAIGASLQVQYCCDVCGKRTERTVHCGKQTMRISGVAWINNDVVNLLCSLVGALTAWGLLCVL
ncbi:MAG: DUF92 domain-containing protein [Ignavibacteriales bacterium]|nr:DUF92 domain-containing protein [Ignavibacteriales bacterium]